MVSRSPSAAIQWTRCTYGVCLCGKRVGKLYYGNGFLGCRHCTEAIYESQKESRRGRLHLKAVRIRTGLGDYGRPGIDVFPLGQAGCSARFILVSKNKR